MIKNKKMKCIVTGGAGFIGSHITDLLISEGMKVIIIDDLSTGSIKNINPKATFIQQNITCLNKIERYFNNVDFVFHLAALPRIQPSFDDPLEHENVNVIGTINCILACRNKKVKKFVYSSSSSCYGNPDELPTSEKAGINCLSPYALQKYTSEQYCLILGERYNIPTIALRYFNVYGKRSFNLKNSFNAYSSVIGILKNYSDSGKSLTITGKGDQSRDFIHVYDVARANLLAALSNKYYDVYNIGYGQHFTINYIASLFSKNIIYIPERKGEAKITWANIEKAKKELKWVPKLILKEGIKYV